MTALNRLRDIIREKSYNTGGDFKLASGATSNFYFDMKPTLLDPEGSSLLADAILDRLQDTDVKAIGGLVIGACPIVSAVCLKSFERKKPLQGFYVHKEQKERGTKKMIEGTPLQKGDRVVIVDDVTTSAGSSIKAIEEVEKLGCVVVKVITVVDRGQGAAANLARKNLELDALFSREDFA